jgi:hypothetical protein
LKEHHSIKSPGILEIDMPSADASSTSEISPGDSATGTAFDYQRSAELFPTRSRKPRRIPMSYRRFDTAAAAVRFAIEELPGDLLLGAYLQVEEERFGSVGIRQLYESPRYPLKRRAASGQ